MIKYILRSTSRSFGRTIGRILAYAVIGIAILLLGSFLNISNVHAYSIITSVNYGMSTYQEIDNELNKVITLTSSDLSSSKELSLYTTIVADFDTHKQNFTTIYQICGTKYLNISDGTINDDKVSVSVGLYEYAEGTGPCQSFDSSMQKITQLTINWYSNGGFSSDKQNYTFYNVFDFPLAFRLKTGSYALVKAQTFLTGSEEYQQYLDRQEQLNYLWEQNQLQQETNDKLDDLNDNLTNSDTTDASNEANDFFNNFEDSDYGLADIIKIPLNLINNITSATCTPLTIPLPFVNTNLTLPCMYDIYNTHFSNIINIYQTITFGIVSYWVCINLFKMVKNFKNPDNDEIEVFEL